MPRKAGRRAKTAKHSRKAAPKKTRKVARKIEPVPRGYHTITPSIIVHDGPAAIDFYKKGFGAKQVELDFGPGGKVWHASLRIGDSMFMLMDEFPEMGANSARRIGDSPGSMWLYVRDVDKLYQQAVAAGATSVREPEDQFWGDRSAMVEDPFGHTWSIATRKERVSRREMEKRRLAAIEQSTLQPPTQPPTQPP